jgi:hypothetical protein
MFHLQSSRLGAFKFAQLFLAEAKSGTLIFTGATAGEFEGIHRRTIAD